MASPRDGNGAGDVPNARRRVPLHVTVGYGSFTAALDGRVLSTSGPHIFWLPPGEYLLEGVLASDGTLGALIQISFTSFRPEGSDDNGVLLGSIRSVTGPRSEPCRGYGMLYQHDGSGTHPFTVRFTVASHASEERTCPP